MYSLWASVFWEREQISQRIIWQQSWLRRGHKACHQSHQAPLGRFTLTQEISGVFPVFLGGEKKLLSWFTYLIKFHTMFDQKKSLCFTKLNVMQKEMTSWMTIGSWKIFAEALVSKVISLSQYKTIQEWCDLILCLCQFQMESESSSVLVTLNPNPFVLSLALGISYPSLEIFKLNSSCQ